LRAGGGRKQELIPPPINFFLGRSVTKGKHVTNCRMKPLFTFAQVMVGHWLRQRLNNADTETDYDPLLP